MGMAPPLDASTAAARARLAPETGREAQRAKSWALTGPCPRA